jgi:hypothetical protein
MRRLATLLLLTLVVAVLPGCGGSSISGLVRYVHAVSDLGPIDILVNGSVTETNIRFKQFTGYKGLGTGTATIRIRRTGTNVNLAERQVSVANNQEITIVFGGKVAPGAGEPAVRITVYNDDRSTPDQDRTEIRAIHGSAENPGPMDVYVVDANQTQNSAGVNPTFNNLDFAFASNFVERVAGNRRVIITPSGNRNTVLFDSGAGDLFSFGSRQKRTLLMVDGNVPGIMDRPVVLPDRDGGIF